MKIAMLYASWEKFGESWSTPLGVRWELESRGHEIKHYNLYHDEGILFRDNVRHYSNQGINQLHSEFQDGYKPDALFVMDYGPWDSVVFDKAHFPGVAVIKECGDEPQAHAQHARAISRVHCMLSPDLPCVMRYHTMGCHATHWPHWADQRIFYPRTEVDVQFDCVTTCGPRGGGLTEAIKKALGDSFNNERYFYGHDHAKRLCMGNMVFQCSQYKEVTRRIFEGMACGKMVITDRLPVETGLGDIFIDGQDIIYYDNAQDAINKIRHYAAHNEERERIAKNGYDKVMAQHTTEKRVDMLEFAIKEAHEKNR